MCWKPTDSDLLYECEEAEPNRKFKAADAGDVGIIGGKLFKANILYQLDPAVTGNIGSLLPLVTTTSQVLTPPLQQLEEEVVNWGLNVPLSDHLKSFLAS